MEPGFWNKISKEDSILIKKVIYRFSLLYEEADTYDPFYSLTMDLEAAHIKSSLDLQRFLFSPDTDFLHDVFGINRHIDRNTGELLNCFSPRCGYRKEEVHA